MRSFSKATLFVMILIAMVVIAAGIWGFDYMEDVPPGNLACADEAVAQSSEDCVDEVPFP